MSNKESPKTEEVSLPALQQGNRQEFAKLIHIYSDRLYRLVLKMLHNTQDAEDVLQNVFIKAFQGVSDFKGKSKISTWLYRIATNEALMLLRSRKDRQIPLPHTLPTDEGQFYPEMKLVDWCCLPEEELLSAEAMEYLDRAVHLISENLRAVFLLRDVEGLTTAETAEILDISEAAVKTRLSRARLRLRELLSGYYGQKLTSSPLHDQKSGQEVIDQ